MRLGRCVVAAAVLLVLVIGRAQADSSGDNAPTISASMREADPRLSQNVTVRESRITVGALLEQLAARTHVSLRAGDRDGAGDVEVAVFTRDVPLGDVLDDLWALVSYRGAEWVWTRDGKPGGYVYRLVRPLRARLLAARLQAEMLEALDREVGEMARLAVLTPKERDERVESFVREVLRGDSELAEKYRKSSRTWAGVATLAEALTPDERRAVLHGDRSVQVPLDRLSPAARAFAHSVWQETHARTIHLDGTSTIVPEPTWVRFAAHRSAPTKMMPMLIIYLEGLGGYAYAGGVPAETAARRRLRDLWLLPGDKRDSELARGKLSPQRQPLEPHPGDALTERRLREFADAAGFPIFVRMPIRGGGAEGSSFAPPYGRAMSDWLNEFDNWFQWKWRGRAMLAADPAWFYDEPLLVPWETVVALRRERDPQTGALPFDSLCACAAQLNPDQMRALAEEFPVMARAASMHDALAYLHGQPLLRNRLRVGKGVPFRDALPLLRAVGDWPSAEMLASGRVRTVQLSLRDGQTGQVTELRLLDSDGAVLATHGFLDPGFARSAHGQ